MGPRLWLVFGVVGAALVAAPALSAAEGITAEPAVVGWTQPSLLRGAFAGARHDDLVAIEERRCRAPVFTRFLDVPSSPEGEWHVFVSPPVTTTYRASFRGATTGTVTVRVRPSVMLRQLSRRRFLVTTLTLTSLWRRSGTVERFDRRTQRWRRVKRFVLAESGKTTGTTLVANGRLRAQLPRGILVRAVLPSSETRPCYDAGVSNMLRTR